MTPTPKPETAPRKLFRFNVIETIRVDPDPTSAWNAMAEEVLDNGDGLDAAISMEELLTPEATLHFTQEDLALLTGTVSSSILAYQQKLDDDTILHKPEWYDRRDALRRLKTKLDGAVWQIAVQRTLLTKGTPS